MISTGERPSYYDRGPPSFARATRPALVCRTLPHPIAAAAAGVSFVPEAVAVERWIVLVPRRERLEERFGAGAHLEIVKAKAGEAFVGARPGRLGNARYPSRASKRAPRNLDSRPHDPMLDCIHASLGSGLVVAGPVLLRRIGPAKIHRAIREHRILPESSACMACQPNADIGCIRPLSLTADAASHER